MIVEARLTDPQDHQAPGHMSVLLVAVSPSESVVTAVAVTLTIPLPSVTWSDGKFEDVEVL